MGGAGSTHGRDEKCIKKLGRISDEKRPLGRSMCRWEVNIGMDLGEMACEGVDWLHLAQGRKQWRALVNTVKNFRIP
jgi:hypothetical protein